MSKEKTNAKDTKAVIDTKANELLGNLKGVKATDRTVNVSLQAGDTFKIKGLCKFDVDFGKDTACIGFVTTTGARVGVRHFARTTGVGQPLGTTAIDNAKFCAYCIENGTEFEVTNVTEREPRKLADGTEYVSKDYSIKVVE